MLSLRSVENEKVDAYVQRGPVCPLQHKVKIREMPPKKSTKKKAPKKRPQKPKTPKAETPEAPLESVGEKPIIDLAELNGSLDAKSRELVEIVELDGKGRGMVAKVDIDRGTEIVRDSPLAASIYGIEVMPIQYGFKSVSSNCRIFSLALLTPPLFTYFEPDMCRRDSV